MSTITDEVQHILKTLSEKGTNGVPDEQLKDFKKRKLIVNQWVSCGMSYMELAVVSVDSDAPLPTVVCV